ncbi:MAG: hypothetical protein FWF46_07265 [Oscillospiraceae bacterium]|nr:hypothetical protein [Oscillospiraceae bacterium]
MEKIKLSEFDVMGIFSLQDVHGIEKYVTRLSDNEYLSRSAQYYGARSYTDLSDAREELKRVLTGERSKRDFVILENMLNCSA